MPNEIRQALVKRGLSSDDIAFISEIDFDYIGYEHDEIIEQIMEYYEGSITLANLIFG